MELIIPSVEIWEQDNSLNGIWEHIARCTRVCYQSTPKENGETDEEFVKRVILRISSSTGELNWEKLHGAMLEHGTVYLKMPAQGILIQMAEHNYMDYITNKYSKVNVKLIKYNEEDTTGLNYAFITTNLRVLYENNWLDDLKYLCAPTEHHVKRVTVSFTTNIGVSREFNRHRVNSIAEESTRYCNYNKRNDGQIKIGLPAWLLGEEHLPYVKTHQFDSVISYCDDICREADRDWTNIDYYLCALTICEYCYNKLIETGWKPQQAREVLPLATKTQLIHTAFIDDWKHFFALRADGVSGPPHPNAKLVAEPLKEEFIKHNLL